MFTGIVKAVGEVESLDRHLDRQGDGDVRLRVRAPGLPAAPGDSIAVNGVCLTVAELERDSFAADVSAETLAVTTLGGLRPRDRVNLEPALAVGEPLGGHLVTGHVDCVGEVARIERAGRSTRIVFTIPPEYRRYLARKGSVCVDGVSLTINEVSGTEFGVNIIPHTAEHTIAGGYAAGTRVNIEVDLVARYLESLLGGAGTDGASQDLPKAQRHA